MLTVLRFILRLFGVQIRSRPWLTGVSNTIEWFRVREDHRAWWGALFHGGLPGLVLLPYMATHWDLVLAKQQEMIALVLAASWAAIGPVLIWHHERRLLPSFVRRARAAADNPADRKRIRQVACRNIYKSPLCLGFTVAWVGTGLYLYVSSEAHLANMGVSGLWSFYGILFLAGVLVLSFYTAVGFCLIYRMLRIFMVIWGVPFRSEVHNKDQMYGLSFIGGLAFPTIAAFASGCLFVPALLNFAAQHGQAELTALYGLLVPYFAVVLFCTSWTLLLVHYKIQRCQAADVEAVSGKLAALHGALDAGFTEKRWSEYEFHRNLMADIRSIRTWPLSLDGAVKFLAATLALPIVAGYVGVILAGPR